MKAILATLLCYLLVQAQCFAHKGGPFDGQKGQIVTTGTFSAILVPKDQNNDTLGLFTLVVPKTGLANGTAIMFGSGLAISGTIEGAVDPKTGSLYAVINAELDITVATSDTTTTVVTYLANGQLTENKIKASKGLSAPRITGDATITYSTSDPFFIRSFVSGPVLYTVLGFKQA
jgi:hypothetical protein